jgi:hypothetical protein
MASDITLAVGDGARRMTYAELAAVRGISALDVREDIRVIREALAVSAPDDREDIRTLQRVLDERDRTIAAHEETIRHLRSLLATSGGAWPRNAVNCWACSPSAACGGGGGSGDAPGGPRIS